MSDNKPVFDKENAHLIFIKEFIKHPLQIGSVIPSSRFLERRIVEAADIATAKVVVELGPGTGGTTRAILRTMPQHARLLCIEINPHFHALVSKIEDSRLIVHLGSASELRQIMSTYDLETPNAVVSGIPFSTLSKSVATQIIEAITSSLAWDGYFVAYQVSKRLATLCQPFLGSCHTTVEYFNIPPMRIYSWNKNHTAQ